MGSLITSVRTSSGGSRSRVERWLPILLMATGALVLAYAVAVGSAASLPYPDPTPELLAHQEADLAQLRTLAVFGAGLLAGGGVWQVARWCWRRSARNR